MYKFDFDACRMRHGMRSTQTHKSTTHSIFILQKKWMFAFALIVIYRWIVFAFFANRKQWRLTHFREKLELGHRFQWFYRLSHGMFKNLVWTRNKRQWRILSNSQSAPHMVPTYSYEYVCSVIDAMNGFKSSILMKYRLCFNELFVNVLVNAGVQTIHSHECMCCTNARGQIQSP